MPRLSIESITECVRPVIDDAVRDSFKLGQRDGERSIIERALEARARGHDLNVWFQAAAEVWKAVTPPADEEPESGSVVQFHRESKA